MHGALTTSSFHRGKKANFSKAILEFLGTTWSRARNTAPVSTSQLQSLTQKLKGPAHGHLDLCVPWNPGLDRQNHRATNGYFLFAIANSALNHPEKS